ncbi:WAT1-related protein isoform C [Glycine soja]|uniref:WAT1-related protein n=1 Tax=Glycine soja TaxID=3848 RepID=A0A445L5L5_GLYSO|nr:WAT1-related protein isoform C [Glycine soja]
MKETCCCASFSFGKAKPYLLTVGLQFGFAGAYIFSVASLNHGMNRYVFVVYRNAIAALALAPFALIFERKIRPKITLPVFLQIVALGFVEPVIDQGFTFLGMQYTSASFASAIMNAVPSVTFVLAVILRLERVNVKEVRSLAKVIGTLVTFSGALLMTLYKGPQIKLFFSPDTTHHQDGSHSPQVIKHWLSGTLFLLLGCVAWSSFFILQVSGGIVTIFIGMLIGCFASQRGGNSSDSSFWACGMGLRLGLQALWPSLHVSLELSLSHWVCTLWYGAKAKTIQTQRRHHLQQSTQRHHSFQLPHLISNTDFLRNLCIVALLLLLPHKSAIVMCVNFLLSVSTLGRDSIRLRQEAVSLALL